MKQKQQVFNPYLPSYEYVPDGEPHVFGDRVYVYGSHDRFNGPTYCMNDYICYSAPVSDLSDWKYEGIIYEKTKDPLNPKGKKNLYAPDVAKGSDGRYYLYYAFDSVGVISIAVCDTPAGEYEFYGYVSFPDGKILGDGAGDRFEFDPGVFVDDDGKVYLYSGFGAAGDIPRFLTGWKKKKVDGCFVIELEADMKTIVGKPARLLDHKPRAFGTEFEGHSFFEASSIRKIGDTYYLIYSSEQMHELCYATAPTPRGPFRYRGAIISNGDLNINGESDISKAYNYTGNNHGGIEYINGEWYVFYHRQTNRHNFSRQAMAEKIQVLEDGSIPQVEMTSCGLNDGPLKGEGLYEARIACNLMHKNGTKHVEVWTPKFALRGHPYFTQTGEDREDNPDQYIAEMTDGSLAGFKYFDIKDINNLAIEVTSTKNGKMEVSTTMHGDPIGTIPILPTHERKWFSSSLSIEDGIHALFFRFKGEGTLNFHHFDLKK